MNIFLWKQDTIVNKVHCWHSKGPGSALAFDSISSSHGFYAGKWRMLQKSHIYERSSRALLTSVWNISQQQYTLNSSLFPSALRKILKYILKSTFKEDTIPLLSQQIYSVLLPFTKYMKLYYQTFKIKPFF